MAKKSDVRDHLEEREWLRSLGKGSILQGIRKIVDKGKEEKPMRRWGKRK